jgi:hypothetical protein
MAMLTGCSMILRRRSKKLAKYRARSKRLRSVALAAQAFHNVLRNSHYIVHVDL